MVCVRGQRSQPLVPVLCDAVARKYTWYIPTVNRLPTHHNNMDIDVQQSVVVREKSIYEIDCNSE